MARQKIVILGSSITALAVARNAYKLGIEVLIFDTRSDVAANTGCAHFVLSKENSPQELAGELCRLGNKDYAYVIATGDEWLRFLVRHWQVIESSFKKILHADSNVLNICLSKDLFNHWCAANQFPTPRVYEFPDLSINPGTNIDFPLMIRPGDTQHAGLSHQLPKAIQVHNHDELKNWCDRYSAVNMLPIITESLLAQPLKQYSVAIARSHDKMVSFVTEKTRPWAEACAVGSYVTLAPNKEIEQLARDVMERMNYFGMAEVEILHSSQSGKNYLIEINARPWLQYQLAPSSGHEFLQFVLKPDEYDANKEIKQGKNWIEFHSDLYYCFSKQEGLVRTNKISMVDYVTSLFKANVYAIYAGYDLKPFFFYLKKLVRSLI